MTLQMNFGDLPLEIFVPGRRGPDGLALVETRRDVDTGGPAILAFSSATRLFSALGGGRECIALPRSSFAELLNALAVDRVVFDLGAEPEPDEAPPASVLRPAWGSER